MTNEEWEKMERTMAFLLDNAARHDAQIQAGKEETAELRKNIESLRAGQERTERLLSAAIEAVSQLAVTVQAVSEKGERDNKMLARMIDEMKAEGERRDRDAERDRRIIREIVADLKDSIHLVNDKADRTNHRLDQAASSRSEAEN